MTIERLNILIDHEINWLYYYGWHEDRANLQESSNIYEALGRMGYTKRVIPLVLRCPSCMITSETQISQNTKLEELTETSMGRGENKLTPLEAAILLFPERKIEFIERIKPKQSQAKVHTHGK